MKKSWPLLVLGGVILFLFIVGTSYAWYNLFSKEETIAANLEISIDDQGNGVTVMDSMPLTDQEGKALEAYHFKVKNNGTGEGTYRLLLQETPFNEIKDGCTSQDLLERNQLRYQLLLNGQEIQLDSVANIKNNVLDIRTIDVGKLNQYELRVWVPKSAENTAWTDKHYHYSVVIVPTTLEEAK